MTQAIEDSILQALYQIANKAKNSADADQSSIESGTGEASEATLIPNSIHDLAPGTHLQNYLRRLLAKLLNDHSFSAELIKLLVDEHTNDKVRDYLIKDLANGYEHENPRCKEVLDSVLHKAAGHVYHLIADRIRQESSFTAQAYKLIQSPQPRPR